jgi:phage gp29-like protein
VIRPDKGGMMAVQLAPPVYNDRFARTYGANLTPQVITSILNAADIGYMWQLADLLDEVRERDGHMQSVLAKREMQVAGAEWELRPPEDSGDKGTLIADWCTARLKEVEADGDTSRGFADMLGDLLGGIYAGRAVEETVWRIEGRWTIPASFEFVHGRRLAYASDWSLHLWDSTGTSLDMWNPASVQGSPFGDFPGVPLSAFPKGKFIVHRPRIHGTYPTREGLGRTCAWYSCFKRFAVRDWLAFAEWAGRGLRIGYFGTGTGEKGLERAAPEDVQVLENTLAAITSSVSTVLPDTTKLDILNSPKNNDVHEKLVLFCNGEQSKAVLGETLTTEVGMTGGNRALGDVHNEVRLAIARSDARALAATLRRDLIAPMVQMNFGPNAPVPTLEFAVDPKADLDSLSKRIESAVRSGVSLGQRGIRNLLQLPDPEPGEELLVPPKPIEPSILPFVGGDVHPTPAPVVAPPAAPSEKPDGSTAGPSKPGDKPAAQPAGADSAAPSDQPDKPAASGAES